MNKKIIITTLLYFVMAIPTLAETFLNDVTPIVRFGYNLGGTAPYVLPASIRSLKCYQFCVNTSIEVNAIKPINKKWSYLSGMRIENKDMVTDAKVKNYHLAIVQGNYSAAGVYTGNINTQVRQWVITLPIEASYNVNKLLSVRMGMYGSYLFSKKFIGSAYNGYLRIGSPIGPKLELGENEGKRGNYNFTNDMRNFQLGFITGFDCHIYHHWGVYADINWGVTGIHRHSFKTIEQTLYPIFGTIGFTYKCF